MDGVSIVDQGKERKGKQALAPSVGVSTTLVSQSSHDEISSIIHSFSAMQ